MTILPVYASIRDSPDDTKDAFHFELQRILDFIPGHDILSVNGDSNATVSKPDANANGVIGRRTIGDRCPNDKRLLQLAKYNSLCLVDTQFEQKKHHLVTWRYNDGVTKSQIDHFLVRRGWRSSFLDARVYRGANAGSMNGSDNFLLICKYSQNPSTDKETTKTPGKKMIKKKRQTNKHVSMIFLLAKRQNSTCLQIEA